MVLTMDMFLQFMLYQPSGTAPVVPGGTWKLSQYTCSTPLKGTTPISWSCWPSVGCAARCQPG